MLKHIIKLKKYLLIIYLCASYTQVYASVQDKNVIKTQMDAFLQQVNHSLNINYATSVALVKNDEILYLGNVGYSNIEQKIPATEHTRYYVASVTKPFMALAQLIELQNSPFNLNSSLNELFPDAKLNPNIAASKITLQNLLNHTSGLNDDVIQLGSYLTGIQGQPNEMLTLLSVNSAFPTGQFDYTNLGYNLISLFDHQTLDKTWRQLIEQHVVNPLGLTETTTKVDELRREHPEQFALPYLFFSSTPDEPLSVQKQDSTLHSAGGIYSSSRDLATFIVAQLNSGKVSKGRQIPASIIDLTHQPSTVITPTLHKGDFNREIYTLGWYEGEYKQHSLLHHFGSFDGYRPHVSFMPEQKIGLVILNNESMLNDKLTDIIADYAYSLMLGEESPLQRVTERLNKLSTLAQKYRKKILSKEQSYIEMPSSLSLPVESYTGKYNHPVAGSVVVSLDNRQQLVIDWGAAHSKSTAYDSPESIRIKFRPSHAQVLHFTLENNSVDQLEVAGLTFTRT